MQLTAVKTAFHPQYKNKINKVGIISSIRARVGRESVYLGGGGEEDGCYRLMRLHASSHACAA